MKLKCKRSECIKKYNDLLNDLGGWGHDDHFNPFHCCIEGCHDISLGKTSYPCDGPGCTNYICQSCGDNNDVQREDDIIFCPECERDNYKVKVPTMEAVIKYMLTNNPEHLEEKEEICCDEEISDDIDLPPYAKNLADRMVKIMIENIERGGTKSSNKKE